ncbi:hypothetical protein [Pseudomonas sessilinigenes]|uniref:CBM6 domain-containing protein n=1 Tax=Pseudomonas sessilinigenes TaxID=658629 RepID=A0ABX8MWX8_9PSED|nr:hypothetical protein [Pseudomonas sessilinigenes]QXH42823.1 hypothetical protein KSS89_11575 [Pseudomonas sessilinigenes]
MKLIASFLFAVLSAGIAHAETVVVRAQDYVSNQNVESGGPYGYGDCIVTRRPGNIPTSAEYRFNVKDGGQYQLMISYAASDPRPVSITVNGQNISSNAAAASTGGWFEGNRIDSNEGIISLKPGENRILISRSSDFPHIHSLTVKGP